MPYTHFTMFLSPTFEKLREQFALAPEGSWLRLRHDQGHAFLKVMVPQDHPQFALMDTANDPYPELNDSVQCPGSPLCPH